MRKYAEAEKTKDAPSSRCRAARKVREAQADKLEAKEHNHWKDARRFQSDFAVSTVFLFATARCGSLRLVTARCGLRGEERSKNSCDGGAAAAFSLALWAWQLQSSGFSTSSSLKWGACSSG